MNPGDLERRMRQRELFSSYRIMPGVWTVVRLDGRAFSRVTADRFGEPFDERFRDLMIASARAIMEDLNGLFACTHSDEISVIFPRNWDLFGRRLEKIVSISAGLASAAFTHVFGETAHFDSRVWQAADVRDVSDYFRWRQADSASCALHGWCYWTLRNEGMSADDATALLKGKGKEFQNELLFQYGINFNDLPVWQRRGAGLHRGIREKTGHDPVRKEEVTTNRRHIKVDLDLPLGEAYERFIARLLLNEERA